MITLATLEQATEQEVFDQVAKHLLTQMKHASSEGDCQYRTSDGLTCAAGCLISEEEYKKLSSDASPAPEGMSWRNLVRECGEIPEKHLKLIADLQDIHDDNNPDCWEEELQNLAEEYKLKFNH